jgi:hypothetical protein
MQTEIFTASTKYGDFKGSAAADDADKNSSLRWLTERRLIQDGENLVGISMSIGENYDRHEDPVHVTFLLSPPENTERVLHVPGEGQIPIIVRRLEQQMPLAEFFGLFKRLEINLSEGGDFEGKVFSHLDY